MLGVLAKIPTFMLPLSVVAWIARSFGVAPHVAQAAAEFLKGPSAVRQAMHLLRDECKEIRDDEWSEAAWGSPDTTNNKAIPLKFYFAKNVGLDTLAPMYGLTCIGRLGLKSGQRCPHRDEGKNSRCALEA